MFDTSFALFTEYRNRKWNAEGGISENDLDIEQKIRQLNWLIHKIIIIRTRIMSKYVGGNINTYDMNEHFEMEIMVESFYYFVGRLEELFKRSESFGNIPRCGALKVRHQLLMHPEKEKAKAKIYPFFDAGSDETGPLIKSYVGEEGALDDAGAYLNATELDEKLCIVFKNEADKNA